MKKLILFIAAVITLSSCEHSDSGGSQGDSASGISGSMARFAVNGDYLYIVGNEDLRTFDISDSTSIKLSSVSGLGFIPETIFSKDGYLYLGSPQGLFIYNIENKSKPSFVSQYIHMTSCDPVIVDGNYAYITLRTESGSSFCNRGVNVLEVIDIRDKKAPKLVMSYNLTNPKGLTKYKDRIYVCDGLDLLVMDAVNPLEMTEIKRISMNSIPYDVIADNDLLTISTNEGVSQFALEGDTIRFVSDIF